MKEVFIPKKLGKVLNKRTSIEERVVIRKLTFCFSSRFVGVFFTKSSNSDIKKAIISEVHSNLEEELEIETLTLIRDCIDYLLSIGYAEVYLSTRYIGACRESDRFRGIRIERGYIIFPKEN